MPLTPGAKLGQSEVVEAIGAGGMEKSIEPAIPSSDVTLLSKCFRRNSHETKSDWNDSNERPVSSPKSITRTSPRSMGSSGTCQQL